MKKEVVAMLLAGGQGSRLYALTSHVAKPAVPFGGKYRIIDFPLSNCVNSGIDTVGVLTQYRPLELNSYIGNGQPWDLDRSDGGVHILPPYMREGDQGTWYKGTANAIYQNIGFLDLYDPEYVVILSGDHIYKMDYTDMLDLHKKENAACTISVLEVTMEEATRFGIMNVDENDRIYEFEEKPKHPKSNLASMGIYIFTWKKLRQALIDDEADPSSSNDFGKNIIPNLLSAGEKLMAYRFHGYWKDVGTIDSLWDANMDMLAPRSSIDLYDPSWPIFARSPIKPPHITGPNARISHSLVTGGSQVDGLVENSVLFHSVTVEEGASVQYSILMPGAVVKAGAQVSYSIVAEDAVVEARALVGSAPDDNPNWGIAVVAGGVTVGEGAVVSPSAMVREDVKGGEQV
ncbi:glucose-1-phosphate adenylyltransferase [Pseudoflavonifractor sp. AF19-9AC]|uniref:glucose-1-phosphate adenylyltransferase n=1 Tax=Pseudoflavonifractor sp. AF19-9AC TaxID=2292244 RepID=UPI000E47CBF2|nr:glucose-1-phosphate adenylyltransferase [Pseudoflavonifractor sp. AF19-9AC]RHR10663.1 glucose-1-phosphate adenylyltransferase [Pseudoflavonifractor sp. AF19-9AC]